MPDYLSPFLQQLSQGAQVMQGLRDRALQQEQLGFQRQQALRQNAREDRMDSNADAEALLNRLSIARPIVDGSVTQRMLAPTGFMGGPDVPVNVTRKPSADRVVSYRTADGKQRQFELMTPEEIAAKRLEDMRAAQAIKMMPTVFTQQQTNEREAANRASRERVARETNAARENTARMGAESRANAAKLGAASRESVAKIGATSRESAAKLGAASRENVAKIGADARLGAVDKRSGAEMQGRHQDRQYQQWTRIADQAEKEEQALHQKKLEAGANKKLKESERAAILQGLDGQIRAAQGKRMQAEAAAAKFSKVASRAQIQAFAKRRGMSEADAIKQARAEGYEVR